MVCPAVRADIVDLTSDVPTKNDSFLVDSNVWLVVGYSRLSMPEDFQMDADLGYVLKAKHAGSKLFHSVLTLAEIAHNIEKTERDLFNSANGTALTSKQYRHEYPAERQRIDKAVSSAWRNVRKLSMCLDTALNDASSTHALQYFLDNPLDGYDLLMLEAMSQHGITNIITNDKDFVTVSGITVFTFHPDVVSEALKVGKLVKRKVAGIN